MHPEAEYELDKIIPVVEQQVIARAALLAHQGKHAEAEAVRYAAGYHNLKEV